MLYWTLLQKFNEKFEIWLKTSDTVRDCLRMFVLTPTSVAQQYNENVLLRFSGNTLKGFILLPLIYTAQQYRRMHCFVHSATIIKRKCQYVTLYVHFLSCFLNMEAEVGSETLCLVLDIGRIRRKGQCFGR